MQKKKTTAKAAESAEHKPKDDGKDFFKETTFRRTILWDGRAIKFGVEQQGLSNFQAFVDDRGRFDRSPVTRTIAKKLCRLNFTRDVCQMARIFKTETQLIVAPS